MKIKTIERSETFTNLKEKDKLGRESEKGNNGLDFKREVKELYK